MSNPPRIGNLIGYADEDVISTAILFQKGALEHAYYHAVQALEKYLKVLAICIFDKNFEKSDDDWVKFLKKYSHNLSKLGGYCSHDHPFFAQKDTIVELEKYSEYDQATRYPWVEMNKSNGFSSEEIKTFFKLLKELRNNIPINVDNYALGIMVRGYSHKDLKKKMINSPIFLLQRQALGDLIKTFPKIDELVRK